MQPPCTFPAMNLQITPAYTRAPSSAASAIRIRTSASASALDVATILGYSIRFAVRTVRSASGRRKRTKCGHIACGCGCGLRTSVPHRWGHIEPVMFRTQLRRSQPCRNPVAVILSGKQCAKCVVVVASQPRRSFAAVKYLKMTQFRLVFFKSAFKIDHLTVLALV